MKTYCVLSTVLNAGYSGEPRRYDPCPHGALASKDALSGKLRNAIFGSVGKSFPTL